MSGWGTLSSSGQSPTELMTVEVYAWTNDKCRESYALVWPDSIDETMLCAGSMDACKPVATPIDEDFAACAEVVDITCATQLDLGPNAEECVDSCQGDSGVSL